MLNRRGTLRRDADDPSLHGGAGAARGEALPTDWREFADVVRLTDKWRHPQAQIDTGWLEAFGNAVARGVRETCAKVCDEAMTRCEGYDPIYFACEELAQKIRERSGSRGEAPTPPKEEN